MTNVSQAAALSGETNVETTAVVPVTLHPASEMQQKMPAFLAKAEKYREEQAIRDAEHAQIDAAFAPVEELRNKGAEIDARYFAPGRQAMVDLLGECYTIYLGVQNSPLREKLIKRLKHFLEIKDGYSERANSTLTGLFLRYVFKDLEPKQVHQYGVALAHAEACGVAADNWASFVKKEGGFEKIRAAIAKKGGVNGPTSARDCADLVVANAGDSLATVELHEFEADTEVIVLVAQKNADGTFDLYDMALGDDELKIINRCWDIMKERKKPAKRRALTEDEKIEKLNAELAVHNQEMIVGDLEANIKTAGPIEAAKLRTKLVLAKATLDAFKLAQKNFHKVLAERK